MVVIMSEFSKFSNEIELALRKPLDPQNVKKLNDGFKAEYVEGWKVIEDANKIFGFGGWSCETVYNREVCRFDVKITNDKKEGDKVAGFKVGYEAKVRVEVNGVIREGTGHGSGSFKDVFMCIEKAAKEAETDALKRAFKSFGYTFGLALYDKTKKNVGNVEEYDKAFAKAGVNFNRINKELSNARTVDDINKIWISNAKDIVQIKLIDKDGMYKQLENAGKEAKENANT
jgi:DNA recombination protein Rad52